MLFQWVIGIFVIACGYCQVLPDYWTGKIPTTMNGTTHDPIPFKIYGSNREYNKFESARDDEIIVGLANITVGLSPSVVNPTNEPPANKSGTLHRVTLTEGLITNIEVLDQYNYDGSNTVPVQIRTSWLKVDEANSLNHSGFWLEDAVGTNTLLNMSMYSAWIYLTDAETAKINKDRYWEIDEYLCYYIGTSVEIVNGKCVLPYPEVIKYYIELWQLNFKNPRANAERDEVSNNYDYLLKNYDCAIIEEDGKTTKTPKTSCKEDEIIEYIPAEDVWLPPISTWYRYDAKPAGIGHAINLTFGHNKTTGSYDLNFTVIFNQWTYDLPEGLLSSFRDFKFRFEEFKFEIWYWVEDPPEIPERPIPESFWIMCFIMIFPSTVLILGILLLVLTKSKKGFDLKVWNYWKEQKDQGMTKDKMSKLKEDKLIEMAELRKQKEAEKYLAQQPEAAA